MGIQVQPCCCPKVLMIGSIPDGSSQAPNYHIAQFDLGRGAFGEPVDTGVPLSNSGRGWTGFHRHSDESLYVFEIPEETEAEDDAAPVYVLRFDPDTWIGSRVARVSPPRYEPEFGCYPSSAGFGVSPNGQGYTWVIGDDRTEGRTKFWAATVDLASGVNNHLPTNYADYSIYGSEFQVPGGGCITPSGDALACMIRPNRAVPTKWLRINLTTGTATTIFVGEFFLYGGRRVAMTIDTLDANTLWIIGASSDMPDDFAAFGTVDLTTLQSKEVGRVAWIDYPFYAASDWTF